MSGYLLCRTELGYRLRWFDGLGYYPWTTKPTAARIFPTVADARAEAKRRGYRGGIGVVPASEPHGETSPR